jgi:monoamine oxidase
MLMMTSDCLPHQAIVLEAQKRLGGRILTEETNGVPLDLGAIMGHDDS